jgi:hypothetical protein
MDAEMISGGIAKYLASKQKVDGSFPSRDFYGLSYSIALWNYFGHNKGTSKGINRIKEMEKGKEFHWEFNNYALLKYHIETGDSSVEEMIKKLKFKGTKVTNWTLLRGVCRLLKGESVKAKREINKALKMQKHGLFLDDKGVRSFQYHCFSTALVGEAYRLTSNEHYKQSFLKGVDFISQFILRNGDALYVGRGQEQLFGYGCLIYILGLANVLTGNRWYYDMSRKVLDYVKGFMRKDGSFPLVLRKGERGFPKKVSTRDKKYLGWYAYNNYFDYLAFFGYWLLEYSKVDLIDEFNKEPVFPDHPDFLVFRNDNYEAVVSKPGGYWTNDMPFPYVCYKKKSIFPCYGGEQFVPSVYSEEAIPLPVIEARGKKILFRRARFSLRNNVLSARSRYFSFMREFDFKEDEVVVRDKIKLKSKVSKFVSRFFFFEPEIVGKYVKTNGVKIEIPSDCQIKGRYFCALGEMKGVEIRDREYELRVLLK